MHDQAISDTRAPRVIEGLPDSAPLLDSPEQLHRRWEADGVLYFRDVIDKDAVATLRREYMDRLKDVGVVAQDADEPIWTGVKRVDGKQVRQIGSALWRALVTHPSLDRVVRTLIDGAPRWVPIVVHRSAPPAEPDNATNLFAGRHQDGHYNYGIEFITCWIPLMDIDQTIGGLAVVPGSHKGSLYDVPPGHAKRIDEDRIPDDAWKRPDYAAGDLLIFHSMTAHAGIPNTSDKLRLSVDVRFLPGSVPMPVIGTVRAIDGTTVHVTEESGKESQFALDDVTIVRGPKATRVTGAQISEVIFEGADILAVVDAKGRAELVRSASRRFLDLPAAWFTELPAGWAGPASKATT
jgi:1-deoxypentalenic acid 11beta-hydroxylase